MKEFTDKKGITLIALIVTIIVLLIIAGISVSLLFGDNSVLFKTKDTKIEQEEANFKEKVNGAVSDYVKNIKLNSNNAYDELLTSLQGNNLDVDDSNSTNGTLLTSSISRYDNSLINEATIKLNSGEVMYSQNISANNISIIASESSGISEDKQNVDITIKSSLNSLDTVIAYAEWTNVKTEPTSGWTNLTLSGSSSSKTGSTYNSNTIEGYYYLWVKITLNGSDTIKRFGPYTIQGTPTADNIIINKTKDTVQADPVTTVKLGVTKTYFEYTLKYSTDNGSTYNDYTNDLIYTNTQITNAGGQITIIVEYTNKNITVTKSVTIEKAAIQKANEPVLAQGMTGVYWDDSNCQWLVDNHNKENWYDYDNKKWANAITKYGSAFVWIPRYEYKISNPHTNTAQLIDVQFISTTQTTPDEGYTIEPAFTFGTTELAGIWVAKFEASGTMSEVESFSYRLSLVNVTIDQAFTACRNMETNSWYGWGTTGIGIDTHLMKNVEWGSVAYLSSSQYGKVGEVWINPNIFIITGQAGTSVSEEDTTSTYNFNNLTYGVNASTTGNVYGIYDMSGGAREYTAAYLNNGNESLENGASLVNANAKYKDVYSIGSIDNYIFNYEENSIKKGDAIYETSSSYIYKIIEEQYVSGILNSWYNDYSFMPEKYQPFFIRGGGCTTSTSAGVFAFDNCNGSANPWFRIPTCSCNW